MPDRSSFFLKASEASHLVGEKDLFSSRPCVNNTNSRVVVGYFARNVVGNVGLRDAVGAGGSDPGHDGSEVTKEVTIVRRQGTTRESELVSTVVGEEGVGMLQESDQHEPMVNPGNIFNPESPPDRLHVTYHK